MRLVMLGTIDGKCIISGYDDTTIKVWNIDVGK